MNAPSITWDDATINRLRALWAEGHSTSEIGQRMGVTKNVICGKVHRLNLPPRPSPIRPSAGLPSASALRMRRMRAEKNGLSAAQIEVRRAAPPVPRIVAPRPPAPPPPVRYGRVSDCCWPIGEPRTPTFRFCEVPTLAGKSYCAQHHAIGYVPMRDRREDPPPLAWRLG
jgi:GcrA cell cycle regulator